MPESTEYEHRSGTGPRLPLHPEPPPQSPPVGVVGQTYLQRLRADSALWGEVLAKLQAGASSRGVARWLADRGFGCNSIGGLANELRDFRKTLGAAPLVPVPATPGKKVPPGGLSGQQILDDLTWALRLLRRRINQSRRTEKSFPLAHPQLTQDLELFRRLSDSRASLAQELSLVLRPAPPDPEPALPRDSLFAQLDPGVRLEAQEAALKVIHRAAGRAWRSQPHIQQALSAWGPRELPTSPGPDNGGEGQDGPAQTGGDGEPAG